MAKLRLSPLIDARMTDEDRETLSPEVGMYDMPLEKLIAHRNNALDTFRAMMLGAKLSSTDDAASEVP